MKKDYHRQLGKICPDCEKPITDTATYCVSCAKKGSRSYNWKGGNRHRRLNKKCPDCGATIDDRAAYCSQCAYRGERNSWRGRKHTVETRAKMSEKAKLRPPKPRREPNKCIDCETEISRVSKRCRPCAALEPGKRQKISKANKGRVGTFLGRHHTQETKDRISEARMGCKQPPRTKEHRRKLSEANSGPRNYWWGKFGPEHPKWKGGRFRHGRYIEVFDPDNPMANKYGYVREHRKVMAETIGRPLRPKEVVHHINEDPTDNCSENLMLFSSNSKHIRICH